MTDAMTDQQRKCLECRQCCEYLQVPVTMLSMEVIDFFLFRGEQMFINSNNGVLTLRIYKPCQYLTENGCSIYENRPEICRNFMCEAGDKSIKDLKEQMCAESMAQIRQAIKDFKEKQSGDQE